MKYVKQCTSEHPMPIDANLEDSWMHMDAKETEMSKELCNEILEYFCPNCKLSFMIDYSRE